jgi:signal transduction histidine kinase
MGRVEAANWLNINDFRLKTRIVRRARRLRHGVRAFGRRRRPDEESVGPVREVEPGLKPPTRRQSNVSIQRQSATDRPLPRPPFSTMVTATSSDRFFRDMVGSMRNGVIAITRDGHIAVMNDVACHALHVPVRPSNIGGYYADVLHGAPEVIRILATAFDSEHLPNRAELRLKSTGRVIGYTLSLIRGDDGQISGAGLFFKDLTRVEQLEERERLRDRLAALGEMAAAIAHEVKNPLAGIEVMAGLLRRRLTDHPEAQATLADIINEAKMANAIVIEVLDFVRPIRLQVEPVPIARTLHDAVHGAEALVPRRDTALRIDVPDSLPSIEGDAGQLRQLFTNLVSNAFEALDGRGTVTITAQYIPGDDSPGSDGLNAMPTVVVDVADDGPGIADDLQDRIFNPFFTTKPRGSGLGLAIVRKIVDAHDGRISVVSPASGGARFRVVLPLHGLPDRTEVPVPQDGGAPGGPRKR